MIACAVFCRANCGCGLAVLSLSSQPPDYSHFFSCDYPLCSLSAIWGGVGPSFSARRLWRCRRRCVQRRQIHGRRLGQRAETAVPAAQSPADGSPGKQFWEGATQSFVFLRFIAALCAGFNTVSCCCCKKAWTKFANYAQIVIFFLLLSKIDYEFIFFGCTFSGISLRARLDLALVVF